MQSNYEPPDFLWDLVEKSTPEHEREEIKRMLGEDLVDQSIELHDEVTLVIAFFKFYIYTLFKVRICCRLIYCWVFGAIIEMKLKIS